MKKVQAAFGAAESRFRQPAVSRIRPPSPYQTDALVVSRTVYKVCFTRYGAEWYVRGFNPQAALRLSVPL